MPRRIDVEIDGRRLSLSNLDKVFYPGPGFTKGQVIDYYTRIAPAVLPHLHDRPLTMKRYPDGAEGPFFYEKQSPSHRPEWVRTVPVPSGRRGAPIDYTLVNDLPTLVWAANLADLELHTPLHRADGRPTMVAFDLDPGPPADIVDCARVAITLRRVLRELGLESLPKTSGSKGMQIYVPLDDGAASYERTKPFALALAELLERHDPEHVVSTQNKERRVGKVLVDWSQNDPHKTTVCVYSLRGRPRPTVSTPLRWEEVEAALGHGDPDRLAFEAPEVLERVEEHGDLFAPVLALRQVLPGG